MFFVRDGSQFPDLVHAAKPSPVNRLQPGWRAADFFSWHPESMNIVSRSTTISANKNNTNSACSDTTECAGHMSQKKLAQFVCYLYSQDCFGGLAWQFMSRTQIGIKLILNATPADHLSHGRCWHPGRLPPHEWQRRAHLLPN